MQFFLDQFSKISTLPDWATGALSFFVYDTLKIWILLLLITHFMSALRWYLPMDRVQKFLTSRRWFGLDFLIATLFGAITPFCSCSSIALFVGFVQARVRLGVTLAFLITSPLVNEVALAIFWSLFGWKFTLLYFFAGIGIGVFGGIILSRFRLEKWLEPFVQNLPERKNFSANRQTFSFKKIWNHVHAEAMEIWKKLAVYILIGVAIGALVHGFVPENWFAEKLAGTDWWSVPVATILAVPLYVNASGAVPVLESLIAKGVPIGTGLAFMMATVGLSLPEALILRRVMRPKLLLTFFGTVTLGIILIGWGFNFWL
ncbi:permease [bacterium]|jgi:uncharacterized protein|nr:permease [bacterium]MBT6832343.1 permease [bacterium]MBT6996438.1 permease [bacterium]MBT7772749.1 permease [bacterium]